jgi:hypothetical protein
VKVSKENRNKRSLHRERLQRLNDNASSDSGMITKITKNVSKTSDSGKNTRPRNLPRGLNI